jgi:hypothetical protein
VTKKIGPTLSDLLAQYSQLHDIRVASVQSDVDAESVYIHLEDLNNFHVGRPEYSGKQPAVLSFTPLLTALGRLPRKSWTR